jgi:hypothetical protein
MKTLDPNLDPDLFEMLDHDPYPDLESMNPDPHLSLHANTYLLPIMAAMGNSSISVMDPDLIRPNPSHKSCFLCKSS